MSVKYLKSYCTNQIEHQTFKEECHRIQSLSPDREFDNTVKDKKKTRRLAVHLKSYKRKRAEQSRHRRNPDQNVSSCVDCHGNREDNVEVPLKVSIDDAQAQENDRIRRETQQQLQLQLGGDSVHIQGSKPPGLTPQSLYPSSQQHQQAYHPGIVASQPDDYNRQQQHQQPSSLHPYPASSAYQQDSLLSQPHPSTKQGPVTPNTYPSHPQQHYPQRPPQQQQPPFYQQPGQHSDHTQTPQTYDPYQQLQLQQQQQQQLQQQYQQQLIELQQQQQLQLQRQQQQLQQQQQPANITTQTPSYNSTSSSLPQQNPQATITVEHIITGFNNNNDENSSNNSQNIPQNNVTGYHTNNPYQLPYNQSNGSGFVPNSQHLTPGSTTMTNSVSKLSHNTDATPIDIYAHSGDVYANPNYVSSKAGPLGMSILDKDDKDGPKVIVLDHSDNEVEEGKDGKHKSKTVDHVRSPSNFKSDVYPISPEAVERDMFKQEYVPQPKGSQNNDNNVNMNIHQGDRSDNERTNQYQNGTGVRNIGESIDPTAFGYPDIINNPDLLLSQPSDSEEDDPQNKGNTSVESSMSPRRLRQKNPLSYHELLQQKLHLQNELYIRQQNENQRQLNKPYSRSGNNQGHDIDLDRYTNVPSQMTSVNEDTTIPLDSYREHLDSSMDTYRTVDPDPFGNDQNGSIDIERESKLNNPYKNDKTRLNNNNTNAFYSKTPSKNNQRLSDQRFPMSSQNPTIRVHKASGYKVDVSGENVVQKRATRTNILNRAERLLDSRRAHKQTDKSDSSDGDLSQAKHDDGYDEEDDDDIQELRGPRHRALRHVKHQYYDDTTSYNSSDDILNTLRFSRQGPLTKAARRARLTSFNARLHKQRRVKAAMRLNLESFNIKNLEYREG